MRNEVMNGRQIEEKKSMIPPRSHLYNLEPIGVGTFNTESLTSYVTRLAEAHNVFTGTLISREIAPLLKKEYLTTGGQAQISWGAGAINGSGIQATEWVEVLRVLTLRNDLHYMTLLTWKDTLTQTGLIRSTQAWCPICFEGWRVAGQVVYEPLLWTLQVLKVCPHHRCALQQRCPHAKCQRLLPWLSMRVRLGYCGHCQGWLGISAENVPPEDKQVEEDALAQQTWVWENMGELIALAPQVLSPPRRQNIERGLEYYIEQIAQGRINVFSRKLGLNRKIVSHWRDNHGVPSLYHLLQLCYQMGISPRSFLLDEQGRPSPALRTLPLEFSWKPFRKPVRKKLESNTLQSFLEAVIATNQEPPLSVGKVARQLGYQCPKALSRRFPDLCQIITARYWTYQHNERMRRIENLCQEVRRIAVELDAIGVYPSTFRIAKLGVLKGGYFWNPTIKAAWRNALSELGWDS
jgi:hypothetical protein